MKHCARECTAQVTRDIFGKIGSAIKIVIVFKNTL